MLDKEEILETEDKIVKALKKEQDQKDKEKAKSEEFIESEEKYVLKDKAEELGDKKDDPTDTKKVSYKQKLN